MNFVRTRSVIKKLMPLNFLVYRFYRNIDYRENIIQPNFNSFPKTGVIFTSIRKVGKTPIENARYGPENTLSNHLKKTAIKRRNKKLTYL